LWPDPNRIARLNAVFYDTTPEWEDVHPDPVEVMSPKDAARIAAFVARHWQVAQLIIHCAMGISRSAGVAAGLLDALEFDPRAFEVDPFDPNAHARRLIREAFAFHINWSDGPESSGYSISSRASRRNLVRHIITQSGRERTSGIQRVLAN
jgi:hypothetical protein